MAKLILNLTGFGLTVYEKAGHDIHEIGTFQADDEGVRAFAAYLSVVGQIPVFILTDLIEEEFRVESIPHVMGRDRIALHKRHASRLFHTTSYRHSRVLERLKENRRDDNVLFSALGNPGIVDQWMECLQSHNMPLVGIHSVPLLSERLASTLGFNKTKVLLLTLNKNSGLRQSYLENGRLKFSRLSPVQAPDSEQHARFVGDEISKTKRYLGSLHFLTPEEKLDVCLISGGRYLENLETQFAERNAEYYQLKRIDDVAKKLGQKDPNDEAFCDRIFIHLIGKSSRPNCYAQPHHQRHFITHKIRKGLQSAGVALILGTLLWSGVNISDGMIYRQQANQAAHLAEQAQARYSTVVNRLPDIPVATEDISAAIRLADFIHAQRMQLRPLLLKISHGLGKYSNFQLNEIAWYNDSETDNSVSTVDDMEIDQEDFNLPDSADHQQERFQRAVIKGEISPFDGNYLRAHSNIEAFTDVLRRQPGVAAVKILTLPLNVKQNAAVEGHFGSQQNLENAKFSVSIRMRNDSEKIL